MTNKGEYDKGISLSNIFELIGSGIKTDRDSLFIDFDSSKLSDRITKLFSGNYDQKFIDEYNVTNSSSYPLLNRIKNQSFNQSNIKKLHYRPFDVRNIYYDIGVTSRPAYEITQHFLNFKNIGLAYSKQIVGKEWKHALVTDEIAEGCLISINTREWTYVSPLYLKPGIMMNQTQQVQLTESNISFINPYKDLQPQPNFTIKFIKYISKRYNFIPTPEEIFGYIYSILYSNKYRKKYYSFLRSEYPKIPFVDNPKQFKTLSKLGTQLIDCHLLNKISKDSKIGNFPISGNNRIDKIEYDKKNKQLLINDTQYFDNIPLEVWNYEIGSYQVVYKWLKERRKINKKLSYKEISHLQKIIHSIKDTIIIAKKIDLILKI